MNASFFIGMKSFKQVIKKSTLQTLFGKENTMRERELSS